MQQCDVEWLNEKGARTEGQETQERFIADGNPELLIGTLDDSPSHEQH